MARAVAMTQTASGAMVSLFKSFRGLKGGNVEPFDWHSAGAGKSADMSLDEMGYRRTGKWERVAPDTYAATVETTS